MQDTRRSRRGCRQEQAGGRGARGPPRSPPRRTGIRSRASYVPVPAAGYGDLGHGARVAGPSGQASASDVSPSPGASAAARNATSQPGSAVAAASSVPAAMPDGSRAASGAGESTSTTPVERPASPRTHAGRPRVEPLSPERYRVQFTVGRETHQNLRRAQELLRREIPDGDPGAIFDRALKLLLADVARKKMAKVQVPRPIRATAAGSRHVPAHVRRAVWQRDEGQCAFVAPKGRRCRERAFLEVHHVEPYAIGAESTVASLSLCCRAHNAHEAGEVFGPQAPFVPEDARPRFHGDHPASNSPRGELASARRD